eukprot:scpid81686/ scgid30176/ 
MFAAQLLSNTSRSLLQILSPDKVNNSVVVRSSNLFGPTSFLESDQHCRSLLAYTSIFCSYRDLCFCRSLYGLGSIIIASSLMPSSYEQFRYFLDVDMADLPSWTGGASCMETATGAANSSTVANMTETVRHTTTQLSQTSNTSTAIQPSWRCQRVFGPNIAEHGTPARCPADQLSWDSARFRESVKAVLQHAETPSRSTEELSPDIACGIAQDWERIALTDADVRRWLKESTFTLAKTNCFPNIILDHDETTDPQSAFSSLSVSEGCSSAVTPVRSNNSSPGSARTQPNNTPVPPALVD